MVNDLHLARRLNLPRTSPTFALRERSDGSFEVFQPDSIKDDGHTYWVSAETTLVDGTKLDTVAVISAGGSETHRFYWYCGQNWYQSDDEDFLRSVGKSPEEVFPFDWAYKIRVENDIYHSSEGA